MADLAVVFHWAPEEMVHFTLAELMEWRELARKRTGADKHGG
ncbi:MAG: GpE family phage tail protein [Halopseudomonas sp.]